MTKLGYYEDITFTIISLDNLFPNIIADSVNIMDNSSFYFVVREKIPTWSN